MTPPRPPAEIASLRRRFASMLYESLLLVGVLGFAFLLPLILLGMATGWTPPGWLAWLHLALALGAYFVTLWGRNGQTLAMQTWRLQVVDAATGRVPSRARCLWRYALAWPSLCLAGGGLLWALLDRDRQFLHDRFAGTCVVFLGGRPGEPLQGDTRDA